MEAAGRRVTSPRRTSIDELDHTWKRWSIGWHALYLGMVAVCGVSIAISSSGAPVKLRALALLAVMTASYLVFGMRKLGIEENSWAGWLHLILAWSCFLGMVSTGFGQVYFMLFALMPQVWVYLSTKWAIAFTSVAVAGLAVVQIADEGWRADAVSDNVPWALLQLGVSLLLGLFITGVFQEAERRAQLIDELEQARAELASTQLARGALAERERLAHEIHDTLAQGFTSVLALAQAAEVALDRDPGLAHERLRLLEHTARDNLAEARALVGDLGPVGLQNATLTEALDRLAARFGDETGAGVDVDLDPPGARLDANAEVVLLRAAQEALANVRKHAGARRVRLGLTHPAGSATAAVLTVADDGCGFGAGQPEGFGLRGMRARVEQVGGTLEIVSAPGAGTTVRISLPSRD